MSETLDTDDELDLFEDYAFVKVKRGYDQLPRKSDLFGTYHEVVYDFWQHDNGDVFFTAGWADSAKGMASEPGRVWAVIPDDAILQSAYQKIPPEIFVEYTTRTFQQLYLALGACLVRD